ncbi:MAG TPA: NAD(P)H-binding protein, partial [Polyangiaceae bacterium]|nr:NAD(P)H-binding protein [Polyangiaceae bacterium]
PGQGGLMDGTILVLGATGKVGGAVVNGLAREGARVRAATRDPARAAGLPAGVERVAFDLEAPATFAPALDGVDRVFLIARPGDEHADRVAAPFLEAMRASGVARVVNLTALGTERRPEFALRRVELAVEASGLAYTHLRPGFFFQLFTTPPLVDAICRAGEIRVPAADARLSFLDARDVGEVGARVLLSGAHDGRAYALTGAVAVDHGAVAAALSSASGAEVRYVPIDEAAARRELGEAGLPPPWVERVITFYRLVRAGRAAAVTGDVEAVLGRPPIDLATFARDHAGVFRPGGEARG